MMTNQPSSIQCKRHTKRIDQKSTRLSSMLENIKEVDFQSPKSYFFAWQLYNLFHNKDNQKIYLEPARANVQFRFQIRNTEKIKF